MESNLKEKLWTSSFLILWQGQLVSTLGDTVYSIALGFWVLSVTGSTALMGTLMAASTLPGVIMSPFAGVLVDRSNRKKLLIIMDFIRGLGIVLVAGAAYKGFIAIWMVFAAGILLSICGAVFRPGVNSCIPDLVPKSKITNANSIFSMVMTMATMIGNVTGGFLFQILGAPFMFFFNGLSYLFSGFSIYFVKIPKIENKSEQQVLRDIKEGFSFVWKLRGLRYIMFIAALMNFFFNTAIILLLPLFQRSPKLGSARYGVVMAIFMTGAMIGYLFMSIIKIHPSSKFKFFVISNILMDICLIIFPIYLNYLIMAALGFMGGLFNSIVNVLLMSSVQLVVPQEMRGKVLALLSMVTQGLTPFAMALGGVLGGILPIPSIMSTCFITVFVLITPFTFNKNFKRFINFDYQKETLEDIR